MQNLLWKGNVVFLVPVASEKRLPLTLSGKSVHGGGSYNDDSKYTYAQCMQCMLIIVPCSDLSN